MKGDDTMRQVWQCQFCGEVFLDQISCSEHEESHCVNVEMTNQKYSVNDEHYKNVLPDSFDLECLHKGECYTASYVMKGDIHKHRQEDKSIYGMPLMYKSRYAR